MFSAALNKPLAITYPTILANLDGLSPLKNP